MTVLAAQDRQSGTDNLAGLVERVTFHNWSASERDAMAVRNSGSSRRWSKLRKWLAGAA